MMRLILVGMLGLVFLNLPLGRADEPRPVPITRPEMKKLLEDMKGRNPRIPLPPLTDEEKAKLGERGAGYEARLRSLYLPDSGGGYFGYMRENEPGMALDYKFKTELFWIVSRTNNCQYCLGHQEVKLAAVGMKEEELAALDVDWAKFTPAEQAAFAYGRKLTFEPHRITDADVEVLRKHFKDLQILEMTISVAGNNSLNRWKEGCGVPQSHDLSNFGRGGNPPANPDVFKTFLTPTPDEYKDKVSKVAPLQTDEKSGKPTTATVMKRPALESRDEVEKALEAARKRTPRLPLADEAQAREILPEGWPKGALPQWVLLVANFPKDGKSRVAGLFVGEEKGDLKPLLKAQVSWIIARQDRAWYALGQAKKRLKDLGQSDDQIYKLDGDWKDFTPADQALFTVARKLASSPIILTDEDVAEALKQTGPKEVVQMISYTTGRAAFDRITEAAGLRLEQ